MLSEIDEALESFRGVREFGGASYVPINHGHGGLTMESTIGAGDFKAKCLQLLGDIAGRREPPVIAKRGKAVAKLITMPPDTRLFGAMTGSVLDEGDICAPIDIQWDSAS